MNNPDELAGLPEDVREALSYFAAAETALEGEGHNGTMYATIRAELVRLARENAELQQSLDRLHGARFSDRACAALKDRAERAEAELTALRRRIAEAPTMRLTFGPTVLPALHDYDPNKLTAISNKRVALLPVGDE